MSTLTLADGRAYAYEQWGDPGGLPLFSIHGTPGGRLSRYPDLSLWERLGLRVITIDRPGYGLSDPLPGRAVSHIAADVAAVADHLGIGRFAVHGGSWPARRCARGRRSSRMKSPRCWRSTRSPIAS